MIIGIGCDIVKVDRIKKLIDRFSNKFLHRIFTSNEIANAPQNKDKAINYYAKRFAAKEAFSKALGTGIGEIQFNEIEISNDGKGKPIIIILHGAFLFSNVHLSLADEKDVALAFVVIEK